MLRLNTRDAGFDKAFRRLVRDRRESEDDVARDVELILADVRNRGDAALVEMTARFDRHQLSAEDDWRIGPEACAQAYAALAPELREALDLAAARIRTYHEAQKPEDRDYVDAAGVRRRLGSCLRPAVVGSFDAPFRRRDTVSRRACTAAQQAGRSQGAGGGRAYPARER